MSDVNFKTEIGPLDGTPEKRMFWGIIADYDLRTGICELVDNAIDLWMGHQPRGSLLVDIQLDADRQLSSSLDQRSRLRARLRLGAFGRSSTLMSGQRFIHVANNPTGLWIDDPLAVPVLFLIDDALLLVPLA